MDRFFDSNNPLMRFLSTLFDLAVLNLVTIVCSIPVITAGAALTAMNNVLIHMVRDDHNYVIRMFRRSFRSNLRQATGIWMIFIGFAIVAAVDLKVMRAFDSRSGTMIMIILTVVSVLVFTLGVYAFALLARYENTVKGTLKNAAYLAIGHLPRTAGIALIWLAVFAGIWIFKIRAVLLVLLFGLTIPGYLCTMIYDPVFRKLEQKENDE